MAIFKGAGVAIVTPMKEVGSVNFEKLGELKINSHLLNDLIERFKNGFILDGTRYIEEE